MKNSFKNKSNQITYISKFIRRYTNIEMDCQYCGNKGKIHNNLKGDPYKIQIICSDCRKIYKVNSKTEMYDNIPLINIKSNIEENKIKYGYLSKDLVKKIKELPKTKLTRTKALKEIGIFSSYEKIISEYEKKYDKDIRSKLDKVFYENRCKSARKSKTLNRMSNYKNNIIKIKLEKNISNKEMQSFIKNKYNDTLYANTISNVSLDKIKPLPKTICYIAESLDSSIADVFPEYKNLSIVYNYKDYLNLNKTIKIELLKYSINNKKPLTSISKELSIPIYVFYQSNFDTNYIISVEYVNKLVKFLHIKFLYNYK